MERNSQGDNLRAFMRLQTLHVGEGNPCGQTSPGSCCCDRIGQGDQQFLQFLQDLVPEFVLGRVISHGYGIKMIPCSDDMRRSVLISWTTFKPKYRGIASELPNAAFVPPEHHELFHIERGGEKGKRPKDSFVVTEVAHE